jgi:hypothetical protein
MPIFKIVVRRNLDGFICIFNPFLFFAAVVFKAA